MRGALPSVVWLVLAAGCAGGGTDAIGPSPRYAEAAARLTAFIEHEMADKDLPALSIALVDGDETVWARGFGWADPEDSVPATAETIYRVGSVSKLFTDIGVMQLVEAGRISLDAPISEYVPEFTIGERAPTLRQLTSHRAGLVREPPVGHYFDDTAPTLEATVHSLLDTRFVYAPEERTKYSNAGIATVGYVLERTVGEPFADHLARAVLAPLGMTRSSFRAEPRIAADLARAYMWTYDGRAFEAPTFELGMAPAGSMYAPVTDLARFMRALFAGGEGEAGRVLAAATLDSMLTPQFAPPDAATGYGIGFSLGRLDGHRRIGHGGAIYGFATDLAALPDEALGAVAVTTMDGANTVVSRVTQYALRLMLAVREDAPLPEAETTTAVPSDQAQRLAGRYAAGDRLTDVYVRGDDVFAMGPRRRARIRRRGDDLVTDGRLGFGQPVAETGGGIVVGGDTLRRLPDRVPPPAPNRWRDLLGEYGWDYNTLYIFERGGRLHGLIEWFFVDPLEEVGTDTFRFPAQGGLYQGENLAFRRDESGRVTGVVAAGIWWERRAVGTADGATFRIEPLRPVAQLREDALAADPPPQPDGLREPDLVELASLDPTIRYDIRYATTNNFMSAAFYDEPRAFMQRPAAEALVRAHRALEPRGLGLLIHDAYRPWYVTRMFWDATPDSQRIFVANPANGSRHNRGAAVDLTLYDRAIGEPIMMVGGYDEFSDRSFPDYLGGTSRQRYYREVLRQAMEAEGFAVYEFEWWHFDYGDWAEYPVLDLTFDALAR